MKAHGERLRFDRWSPQSLEQLIGPAERRTSIERWRATTASVGREPRSTVARQARSVVWILSEDLGIQAREREHGDVPKSDHVAIDLRARVNEHCVDESHLRPITHPDRASDCLGGVLHSEAVDAEIACGGRDTSTSILRLHREDPGRPHDDMIDVPFPVSMSWSVRYPSGSSSFRARRTCDSPVAPLNQGSKSKTRPPAAKCWMANTSARPIGDSGSHTTPKKADVIPIPKRVPTASILRPACRSTWVGPAMRVISATRRGALKRAPAGVRTPSRRCRRARRSPACAGTRRPAWCRRS
jgi:hypothetical protein